MPTRLNAERLDALNAIVEQQAGLVTAAQLRTIGFHNASVSHRVARSGIWQRLLPGIYLTTTGPPDEHQRRLAALLYGGRGSMLTGCAALAVHGSRVAVRHESEAALLVPHHRKRSSTGFVVVERTTRWPTAVTRRDLIVAPAARAALDAARRMERLGDVRALLSDAVQSGLARPQDLERELREGQRRGSRLPRLAIEAIVAGTRSAPEAALREAWIRFGLPEPLWNPTLRSSDGRFLARPDVYLPDAGLAIEVDSKEFHYSDSDWRHTMERRSGMTAEGLVVMQVPPSRLGTGSVEVFLREVAAALARLGSRLLPHIVIELAS